MNPELVINPQDGSIQIKRNEYCTVIDNTLTSDRALTMLAPFYFAELDHGNGYRWCSYDGININGMPGSFALCFHAGRLTQVHIGVSLPTPTTDNVWTSQALIEREVSVLRSSLIQQLSRSFVTGVETFTWGRAWVNFDAKGFSASAGIRYRLPDDSC